MDIRQLTQKAADLLKQYKYVLIVVIAGILLMLLPGEDTKENTQVKQPAATEFYSTEQRLTEMLSQIRGAGRVQVMLTEAVGAETIYKTDEHISAGGETSSSDTVTVTDENRAETGLITQIIPPRYLGALIVCKGADDPRVRLAIIEAVSSLTGLRTDSITIVRMK